MDSSVSTVPPPSPPVAKRIPKRDVVHGDERIDDYFWLREKENPDVIAYLDAENAYTEAMTKSSEELRERLYREIVDRTKQTDLSVPYRFGEYWYYTRTEEGKQYPIHCRKKGTLEGAEVVILDLNSLAEGHSFLGLGFFKVTDDGSLLAYSIDTTGFREYRCLIKDLRTDEHLPDRMEKVSTAEWSRDGKTLFYVEEDTAKRPFRLHRLILDGSKDEVLYEEGDELYRTWLQKSSDRKYIFLAAESAVTGEVRYLKSERPGDDFTLLYRREGEHEYSVDHREGLFYIRTNRNAKNFRLVTVPADDPDPGNWKELVPHRPEVKLDEVLLFRDHAVFCERRNALTTMRILDFRTNAVKSVGFPEPVYSAFPGTNPEFDTAKFRFTYQSFVTPPSVYEYDMDSGAKTMLKQTEVLGGYDPSVYESARIEARAADGTAVPISLVYRKGLRRDGLSPLLLYGYGSYGISIPVTFSVPRLSLLERGVVYALAHIRGGGDLGEQWRDDGKMLRKKNTFTDFVACAEHLLGERYTSSDRLAIEGGSAGGLLVGAVLNMRPDLFKAAHLAVPFVDVTNTMLDATLPLTIGEYLEWGNPNLKEEYEYMKSYCPYTNISPKKYPDILITTSLNDSQVMYWEPAKYTAKLRATKTGESLLLLKMNMGAGHGGASGRYDAFREQAFVSAFLLNEFGIRG
ncbi:MAG TPA: S9 family peptidase [Bacteroidota bacterium]|nr:S9 family peptidase [Bacteroidota bacterium]